MHIEENKSLKKYNSFGIDCTANYFSSIQSVEALKEILSSNEYTPLFILGGGSNMLLTKDIDALVLHIDLKGITLVSENDNEVIIEVMAGENWHQFVEYCLDHNYGGIENLSLIPGNVGTAPIQNIGAYGVELKDVFESCEALHIESQELTRFELADCQFGYRDSIFKREAKGKYVITSVRFKLTKHQHQLRKSYGAIQDELDASGVQNPTIQDISRAVINIRESKLPDPKILGNSGSFFKNPVVSLAAFNEFRQKHPEAPYYEVSATEFKIPAGWLIEKAGWKGRRIGDAGVHEKQALVLVNYGNASGTDIWHLALMIQKQVKEHFGVFIEPEVNVF